jgi:tetratricopeptide (TPR) repeat protein
MSQPVQLPIQATDHDDCLQSAQAKYAGRDYQGAVDDYTRLIQSDSNDAISFCGRGSAYYKLGDRQKAMADYNQSISINSSFALTYYRRGALHYANKDYVNAIADYNQATVLKADFALAYSNRGHAYRELYGEQEALIDWRFAAKLFKEQGNLKEYQNILTLIDGVTGVDSSASGMLS